MEARLALAGELAQLLTGSVGGKVPMGPLALDFLQATTKPVGSTANEVTRSIVPGEIIVAFDGSAELPALRASLSNSLELARLDLRGSVALQHLLTVGNEPGSQQTLVSLQLGEFQDVLAAGDVLRGVEGVAWVEPNYAYRGAIQDFTPNDPSYGTQYHHPLMQNNLAWDTTLGSPTVIVAVTDDGMQLDHPDLVDNLFINTAEIAGNGIDDDMNGFIDDRNGWDFVSNDNDPTPTSTSDDHGTHVAGIIAGRTNNAVGIAGTAGGVKVMPLRFAGSDGGFSSTIILNSFRYAADNGAKIVSTSYNIDSFVGNSTFVSALQYLYDNNVLHLNSAGNNNQLNPARQAFHQTLLVASTTSTDVRSSFSNYGTGVDVAAPGSNILSTVLAGDYASKSGTSMATPNAAGVAALIWSANPTMTRDQVAARLVGTATNINTQNPTLVGLLGGGRVNSNNSLNATLAAPRLSGLREIPTTVNPTIFPISQLTMGLSNVLDKVSVETAANWTLVNAGTDDTFGTADDQAVVLTRSAPYMAGANDVRFTFPTLAAGSYRFTGVAGGLRDPFTTALDGDANGTAGGNFVKDFRVANLTTVFQADFSDADGAASTEGFTTSGPANAWHLSTGRGNNAGHSSDDSFYFGAGETSTGGGSYLDDADGSLTSPVIDLTSYSGTIALDFNHFLASESGYDFASVSVIDGAVTTEIARSGGLLPHDTTGFQTVSLSLSAYAGRSIQLQFRFTTDGSITEEGWYVDDVIVRATSATGTSGSIAGQVWSDDDGDGVIDAGELGLNGWTVFLDDNDNGTLDGSNANRASTDVPKSITDNTTVTSQNVVSGLAGLVTDINVTLNITHTYDGDLDIFLISPTGTRVELATDVGNGVANFTNTVFDDQAATAITAGTAPYTGSFQPEGSLATLNGLSPNGAWVLEITDDAGGDVGSLTAWSLQIVAGERSTTTSASGDYQFAGLLAGAYSVRQVLQAGFQRTFPASGLHATTVLAGQSITGLNFGDRPSTGGEIRGTKWSDLDSDGLRDAGEPSLPGWTIYIDSDQDGVLDAGEPTAVTDVNGNYALTGLTAGLYTLMEVPQTGYTQSYPQLASSTNWVEQGPAPIGFINPNETAAGRITGIAAHPTDSQTYYIVGAHGGVWKTVNGGTSWVPLTDNQITTAMGAIAISRSNPNIIYAGTGESSSSGDSFYGRGVLKSTDSGATWVRLGVTEFDRRAFSKIVVHPTNPDIVFGSTTFAVNGLGGNMGVWRSLNGGTTWTNTTASISTTTQVMDLLMDPTNPDVLYAGLSYGNQAGIYKTIDGGNSWTILGGGIPTGTAVGRWALANAADGATLYATAAASSGGSVLNGSIYVSTNSGSTWTARTIPNFVSTQGWYDQVLAVDPTNPSRVYAGGAANSNSLLRSNDAGVTWTPIITGANGVSPHVDHHAFAFDAAGRLLNGNDGGIWRTDDLGANWTQLNNNLSLTQFYDIALHPTDVNIAYGGTQDNGTIKFTGSTRWTEIAGGDGGVTQVDYLTPNTVYQSFQNDILQRSDNAGATFTSINTGVNTGDNNAFIVPYELDPTTPTRLVRGTDRVYLTTNRGDLWTAISPVLGSGVITALAIAKTNANTIYATYSDGSVWATFDGGGNWLRRDTGLPEPPPRDTPPQQVPYGGSAFVTNRSIVVDPFDNQTVFVVRDRFGQGKVWKSTNGGQTWNNITANLPDVPAHDLVIDPRPAIDDLYVSTDGGIFRSTNSGSSWSLFGAGVPNTAGVDLEINLNTNRLAAGTHGRGMWTIALPYGAPGAQVVSLPTGELRTGVDFGNAPLPTQLSGAIWNDVNGNRVRDVGDSGLSAWTLYLDTNSNGSFDSQSATRVATDVPKSITDFATVTSQLPVTGITGPIADLNVTFDLTHTYDGDLDIFLISPAGTRVELATNVGGSGDNFINTVIDDEAATSITAGTAPFTGSFRPEGLLGLLDGTAANGTWLLEITDEAGGDIGSLTAWSLQFTTSEPATVSTVTGDYLFTGLTAGNYVVREVVQATWSQTVPISGSHNVVLVTGQTVANLDFANTQGNTAPTIADIPDQTVAENGSVAANFTISDVETPLGSLTLSALTSNATLLPLSGIVFSGTAGNRTVTLTPAANQSGAATVTVIVTDGSGATAQDTFVITVNPGVSSFRASAFTPTSTGVVVDFNRDLDVSALNLYDVEAAVYGPADVTLVGATSGAVRGSVVIDPNLRRLTFISTVGALPPDSYTLTLRSAANGFVDSTATLLDGDANGTAGGNYVQTFSVVAPPANAVTLSVANFARGPLQSVNIPATATSGLPISFSDGGGITVANFQIRYNPALLTITGATVAPGMPGGSSVNIDTSTTPGVAVIQFSSPTPLASGTTRFIDLQATVPVSVLATAPYRSKHVLDIANIVLNPGPNQIPSVDDDGVHVFAYFGDATGNGTYGASDASRVARVGVGFDTGFQLFKLLDPVIIGDITGNNSISAFDASRVLQVGVAFPVAEIPPLPLPGASLFFGGPDPKLSIPTDLVATAGSDLIVPVQIDSILDLTGTGFESADLVLYYDPAVLDVTSVSLGSLVASRGDWIIASQIDASAGRIFVSLAGHEPLEGFFIGELVQLHATVKANASIGSTTLNIAAHAPNTAQFTQVNDGFLTLIPAPTNGANDPGVDGLLTIVAASDIRANDLIFGDSSPSLVSDNASHANLEGTLVAARKINVDRATNDLVLLQLVAELEQTTTQEFNSDLSPRLRRR